MANYAANVIVIDVIVNISIPCALKSYLFKLTVSFVPVYNTFAKKRVISDHFVGHSVLDDLLSWVDNFLPFGMIDAFNILRDKRHW